MPPTSDGGGIRTVGCFLRPPLAHSISVPHGMLLDRDPAWLAGSNKPRMARVLYSIQFIQCPDGASERGVDSVSERGDASVIDAIPITELRQRPAGTC